MPIEIPFHVENIAGKLWRYIMRLIEYLRRLIVSVLNRGRRAISHAISVGGKDCEFGVVWKSANLS